MLTELEVIRVLAKAIHNNEPVNFHGEHIPVEVQKILQEEFYPDE